MAIKTVVICDLCGGEDGVAPDERGTIVSKGIHWECCFRYPCVCLRCIQQIAHFVNDLRALPDEG